MSNIQSLVHSTELLDPDSWLNILSLAKCGLPGHLALIELHRVLSSNQTELDYIIAKMLWMRERVRKAEEDSEALHVVRAGLEELTAERASLTVGIKQAKAKCDTLIDYILKL